MQQKFPLKTTNITNNINLNIMIENQKVVTKQRKTSAQRNFKANDSQAKSRDKQARGASGLGVQQQSMLNANQAPAEQVKLKIKRTGAHLGNFDPQPLQNTNTLFNATGDVYKNDYISQHMSNTAAHSKYAKHPNATMDLTGLLHSVSKLKSPLIPVNQQDNQEYEAFGRGKDSESHYQQQDDEYYQDIEQEVKVPNFLSRASLENNGRDKNQFYMTQIINQPPSAQKASLIQAGPKHAKSQVRPSSSKRIHSQAKSSQGKSTTKHHLSPHSAAGGPNLLDKYMNLYEILQKPQGGNSSQLRTNTNGREHKKRAMNTSALLANHHRMGDLLNSTAPLNLTQIMNTSQCLPGYLMNEKESAKKMMGFSEAVNSTQNFHRINSKESWKPDPNLNMSSYYNGVGQGITLQMTSGGSNTRQTASPIKDQRKKQLMIKNLMNQESKDKQSKKYFLNLTLQQLMHQQTATAKELEAKKTHKTQKRLNKTLDNFRDSQASNAYYTGGVSTNDNLKSFVNNFLGSYQQQFLPKKGQNRATSKNKFSSTMKIQDLNQMQQIFDVKSGGKKSKNSLKSTQNLNFHNEDVTSSKTPTEPFRKYSALSTYSLNTAALPTTSHLNQVKNRKLVSSSKKQPLGVGAENNLNYFDQTHSSQVKKKEIMVEEQNIQAMLKLYQSELTGKSSSASKLKNKTLHKPIGLLGTNTAIPFNANCTSSKHKTNATLGQYLRVGKLGNVGQSVNAKKEKGNASFLSTSGGKHGGQSEMKSYQAVLNMRKERTQSGTQQMGDVRMSDMAESFKNTCMDLEGKLNPYSNKTQAAYSSSKPHNNPTLKDLQNKTQPIPKQLLDMVKAEALNLSTGTSIIAPHAPQLRASSLGDTQAQRKSQQSRGKSLTKVHVQPEHKQQQLKPQEDPSRIYNNKNTVILDEEECLPEQHIGEDHNMMSKLERYTLGKQIGQGAYAVVRVAQAKKDGQKYAIKIYDKSKLTDINRQRSVRREIKLLQKMNHQNIVKIYEAFETENHVYLVMEYVGGGSLHSYLKEKPSRRLEEEDAKFIFKQILTSLQYCHRKSIAHRDIKLENILLDENKNVKLIDFGFSTCIPNDKKIKMFCGTPSYMAPQIVTKEEYAGPPADIWASGVLLYALMNGCFPFRGATDKELYRRIQRGTFVMHNQKASSLMMEFLEQMININADERPSAEELLNHQWFKVDSSIMTQPDQQSISDQKKLFKAKILSKIPIEKTNNNICLISHNEQNSIKLATHNINLGQQHTQFRSNALATQQDCSDYGLSSSNPGMRKLNQEAYQAYYNTSGGNCNYGLGNVSMPNPYYNNFLQANVNYVNQQHQIQGNINFPNKASSPNKTAPSLNIATQQEVQYMMHQQLYPNQVGTPQVFGSPTIQQYGGTANNNWVIKHVDTLINVYNSPPQIQEPQLTNTTSPQHQIVPVKDSADDQAIELTQAYPPRHMNEGSDYDREILDSLAQMGYHRSHVVSQLECETSHITQIYSRMKDEKMSKTQQRPLSQQPNSRRPGHQQHNNAVFPPNFIPSIADSVKAAGDTDYSAADDGKLMF